MSKVMSRPRTGIGSKQGPTRGPVSGWKNALIFNKRGEIEHVPANADLILSNDSRWKGVLAYNSFTEVPVLRREPPEDWVPKKSHKGRAWEDPDTSQLGHWLSRQYRLHLSDQKTNRVVDVAARRETYHPVRMELEEYEWDGIPRIDTWLIRLGGAKNNPLTRAISARFLISAVARIFQPGCQADHVLILEGIKGIGKTTLVRILAGEQWFLQRVPSDLGIEAQKVLRGKWIAELGELNQLTNLPRRAAALRDFVSQVIDRYRDSYGFRPRDFLRQIVFIATVNPPYKYSDDAERRWWPVELQQIDLAGVRAERAQLWAEAVHRYRAGEKWHIDEAMLVKYAAMRQEDRRSVDPWEDHLGQITEKVRKKFPRGVDLDYLHSAMNIDLADRSRATSSRIIQALVNLKWTQQRTRKVGGRPIVWIPPKVEPASGEDVVRTETLKTRSKPASH